MHLYTGQSSGGNRKRNKALKLAPKLQLKNIETSFFEYLYNGEKALRAIHTKDDNYSDKLYIL